MQKLKPFPLAQIPAPAFTPRCSPPCTKSASKKLTEELARDAQLLITMGCGDNCPYVPGLRRDDWPLRDPKGQPVEEVRIIRDEIRARVELLLAHEGLGGSARD
jgi:arsenate reductase